MTETCCRYFTITSNCYTITLHLPSWNSEDNKLNKLLEAFTFWSENYKVDDQGIEGQPLVLSGVEAPSCDADWEGAIYALCVPFCFTDGLLCVERNGGEGVVARFFRYFRELNELMDNHEEVIISGLGSCMDAVYIIKDFKTSTIPGLGLNAMRWNLTLEKKRDTNGE
ncbi:unnamed protein product [marine sediment metagenome]|uniref:Uncharacterized protein n=1 Tax=marine sediment metagenome TaxID=412755 RepID=X0VMS1_9ZZZZ